jgi:hypothetical protein
MLFRAHDVNPTKKVLPIQACFWKTENCPHPLPQGVGEYFQS